MRNKRRWGLALVAALAIAATVMVAQGVVGFEQVTVSSTAIGLTQATYRPTGSPAAITCKARLRGGSIMWRADGTNPTSTIGEQVFPNEWVTIEGQDNMSRFKAIRAGSTDGILPFHCYQ